MEKKDKGERRRFIRVPQLSIVHITRQGILESLPGLMVDIGFGGMRFLSQMPLIVGEKISVLLELEEGSKTRIEGKIVWKKQMEILRQYNFGIEYVHGLQFMELPDKIRALIEEYLEY